MARVLMIDATARAEVARVVSYAMEHPYVPYKSPVPGDNPNFVAMLDSYRAVFTFTHLDGKVYRHLTISIPRPQHFPNTIAAFMIAELFGFSGYDGAQRPDKPADDWIIDVKRDENAVMIAQET